LVILGHAMPNMSHLDAELRWLRSLLAQRAASLQAVGLAPSPDERLPGTVITDEEAAVRLTAETPPTFAPAELEERLRAAVADREAAEDRAEGQPPLCRIRAAFDLDDAEYLLLLLAVAAELDPGLPRLYAWIQNHFERQYATLALLYECVPAAQRTPSLRRVLDSRRPLLASGLVVVADNRPDVPTVHRAVVASDRIVRAALGFMSTDPTLDGICQLVTSGPRRLLLPEGDRPLYEQATALAASHAAQPWELPVFVFRGPEGCGRTSWSSAVAAQLNRPLMRVDLEALMQRFRDLAAGLVRVASEARLQDAVIALAGWETITSSAGSPPENGAGATPASARTAAARTLDRVFADHPGALVLMIEDRAGDLPLLRRPLEVVDISLPDRASARALWDRLLPARLREPGVDSETLAAAFSLTPGQIERAVAAAAHDAARSEGDDHITEKLLRDTIKTHTIHRLGETADLVTATYQWDDLVVSDEIDFQLRELVSRYRHRAQVLQDWGLGRRFGDQLGISALFDGPPGTGKTMAASVVADKLGLDLFRIDLSKVVNRYVGETEKNLARIFSEAERAQAVLLFDEADSLFASRTTVQSSNDRYANLEVNYLLQRIETFSGVAILTTNFAASIDDAFIRRLSMRVTFDSPDVEQRERLWRTMLAFEQLPRGAIDYPRLAREFDLSGGHIRNAVLEAAFVAAAADRPVDTSLLQMAARIALKQQGKLVQGSPHGDLWRSVDLD